MRKLHKKSGFTVSEAGDVWGIRGKLLKLRLDTKGYDRHAIKKKEHYTHQMVWDLFGDGSSRKGLDINHKNGVKTDNSIANLEVVTRSENIKHAYTIGLTNALRNMEHPSAKLSNIDVYLIKNFPQAFVDISRPRRKPGSVRAIASIMGVHHSIINRINNGSKII